MNASGSPASFINTFHILDGENGRKRAQKRGANGRRILTEADRTQALKLSLPRGVTIGFRADGREKPWFVRHGPRSKRKTESFETERERNNHAEKLGGGGDVSAFDPGEWRDLQRFKQRTGISLAEAEEIVMRVRGNLQLNLSTDEAVKRYLDLRIAEGLPAASQVHPKIHLTRFCACTAPGGVRLGALALFSITSDHVRHWLAGLREQKLSPVTLRHHRKNLNVFFERAVVEKWCIENPCAAVVPPKVPTQTTPILSPEEIFRLLKANHSHPFVGRLALELFGGLRASSAARVVSEDIRPEIKGVLMRGDDHKSGKRQFRQGHPPVLWDWVAQAGDKAFEPVILRTYYDHKSKAFARAGWDDIPHNRLRHCFASYLLAAGWEQSKVARLMQHTSWRMLERYEGVATENDAKQVLSMTPSAVLLTWEEFQGRWTDFCPPSK